MSCHVVPLRWHGTPQSPARQPVRSDHTHGGPPNVQSDSAAGATTPRAALARRMQHEKRPREEAGASAYGLADKRARLAPRVSFAAAGTPWLPAFATPASLSKVRAKRLRCQPATDGPPLRRAARRRRRRRS